MYAVRVKKSALKRLYDEGTCSYGEIWVVDNETGHYVSINERGLWSTKEEAESHITEDWEEVVEVKDHKNPSTKNSSLKTTNDRYKDLLKRLGVQCHDEAIAEIASMRKALGLDIDADMGDE